MNKRIPLLVLLCLSVIFSFAQSPDHVVISQVYGGGGNDNAPFKNDFVELYNPTGSTVSLVGWSLQYASATGSNWGNKVLLTGSIGPGQYFLIKLKSENPIGADLPTPDQAAEEIGMSATAGKVALLNHNQNLTGICPTAGVIDLVGYGGANCQEGSNAAAITSQNALLRLNHGCKDDNNNATDFYVAAPNPRNSAAPTHSCSGGNIVVSNIESLPVCINNISGALATVHFTATGSFSSNAVSAYLSDAAGVFSQNVPVGNTTITGTNPAGAMQINIPAGLPSGTGYRLRLDGVSTTTFYGQVSNTFEVINGAKNITGLKMFANNTALTINWTNPPGCFDEVVLVCKEGSGINGLPAGDGSQLVADLSFTGNGSILDGGKVVYKGNMSGQTITGLTRGMVYYLKIFTRKGNNWSSGVQATETMRWMPSAGDIVINQFNPGYSTGSDEYIELVNTTGHSFELSDLNILYQSSSGGSRLPEGLSGTLLPYSYWLLATKPTVAVGISNINADVVINDGYTPNAQFAIARKFDNVVIDALGYGTLTGGNLTETAAAGQISSGDGLKRKAEGVDQNNNRDDFETVANANIDLRNSQSRLAKEGAVISAASNLKRIYVTGNAQIASNIVLTEKLVLQAGKLALNDFHLTTQNIEGGNANAYVQTNGTGSLAMPVTGATPRLFPVGRSTYNPVTLQHAGNLTWSVNVLDAVQAANPDGAVQRTWNITPSAVPTTGATVSFQYDEGDATQLGSAFDVADQVQVYHQHEGVWKKAGDPVDPAGAAGGIRTVTLSNWTQFSAFVLNGAAQGPLPVKFAGLRLFAQGTDLVLQFTVHNELGVDHYKVETSADGHKWEVRALLKPQSNSGATVQYEFRDARPLVADRYYRVQAIEATGAPSFSGVAKARAKWTNAGLQVAPNPVVGTNMHYTCGGLPAGNYTVRIVNGAGQPVLVTRMVHAGGWLSANLALPHLQGGWYVLELAGPQTVRQTFLVR